MWVTLVGSKLVSQFNSCLQLGCPAVPSYSYDWCRGEGLSERSIVEIWEHGRGQETQLIRQSDMLEIIQQLSQNIHHFAPSKWQSLIRHNYSKYGRSKLMQGIGPWPVMDVFNRRYLVVFPFNFFSRVWRSVRLCVGLLFSDVASLSDLSNWF